MITEDERVGGYLAATTDGGGEYWYYPKCGRYEFKAKPESRQWSCDWPSSRSATS